MRTYALCGLSNRGVASFLAPLLGVRLDTTGTLGCEQAVEDHSHDARVVAVCDVDVQRARDVMELLRQAGAEDPPTVHDSLVALLTAHRPDVLIIASPDDTHAGCILTALEQHDLHIIVEKPMTRTAAEARRVLAAVEEEPSRLRVSHNLRYDPRHQRIKRLLSEQVVGRPLQVMLNYFVDLRHGASYFLRWHRSRERSGGLSVHKSTHHIDLVNWWLGMEPRWVVASGGRAYFGADSPHRPRDGSGRPLRGSSAKQADPYQVERIGRGAPPEPCRDFLGLAYPMQYPQDADRGLYDEEIDIEDHFSALIGYDGASLSYGITFSAPWEGYRLVITGTHGQIETSVGQYPDGSPVPDTGKLVVHPLFSRSFEVPDVQVGGGHERADLELRRELFGASSAATQRLGLAASPREGAVAVAAGEAIWRSILQARLVRIEELLG